MSFLQQIMQQAAQQQPQKQLPGPMSSGSGLIQMNGRSYIPASALGIQGYDSVSQGLQQYGYGGPNGTPTSLNGISLNDPVGVRSQLAQMYGGGNLDNSESAQFDLKPYVNDKGLIDVTDLPNNPNQGMSRGWQTYGGPFGGTNAANQLGDYLPYAWMAALGGMAGAAGGVGAAEAGSASGTAGATAGSTGGAVAGSEGAATLAGSAGGDTLAAGELPAWAQSGPSIGQTAPTGFAGSEPTASTAFSNAPGASQVAGTSFDPAPLGSGLNSTPKDQYYNSTDETAGGTGVTQGSTGLSPSPAVQESTGFGTPGPASQSPSVWEQIKGLMSPGTMGTTKDLLGLGGGLLGLYNAGQGNSDIQSKLNAMNNSGASPNYRVYDDLVSQYLRDPMSILRNNPGYQASVDYVTNQGKRQMAAQGYNMSGNSTDYVANLLGKNAMDWYDKSWQPIKDAAGLSNYPNPAALGQVNLAGQEYMDKTKRQSLGDLFKAGSQALPSIYKLLSL